MIFINYLKFVCIIFWVLHFFSLINNLDKFIQSFTELINLFALLFLLSSSFLVISQHLHRYHCHSSGIFLFCECLPLLVFSFLSRQDVASRYDLQLHTPFRILLHSTYRRTHWFLEFVQEDPTFQVSSWTSANQAAPRWARDNSRMSATLLGYDRSKESEQAEISSQLIYSLSIYIYYVKIIYVDG